MVNSKFKYANEGQTMSEREKERKKERKRGFPVFEITGAPF